MSRKLFTLSIGMVMLLFSIQTYAQTSITGKITDSETGEALIGVSIAIKGTVSGTVTNVSGDFSLNTKSTPPFTLVFSSVGYDLQQIEVDGSQVDFSVQLIPQTIQGKEVIVSASKVEESIMEAPVTIERMDISSIRNSPASNFYEALQNLKGVDVSTNSLTFQSPNTRGFGSNGNFRMIQLIDGIDNQGPGLNFSPGNLIGASELDIESVELLPGASSVLYGPGAINGTILMTSKSPFLYQGFSAYVKFGMMHSNSPVASPNPLYDVGFRYAKAFNDKFAFKVNFGFLQALDWHASDYQNRTITNGVQFGSDNSTIENNAGYYGVNNYGGQISAGLPIGPIVGQDTTRINVARTGYNEQDLVDYTARNIKGNLSLHYRINENLELIGQLNMGFGTSVYTGGSRVQIRNFLYGQTKLELKASNFFIRAYTTQENSGDSYDIGLTAVTINNAWKSNQQWFEDYGFAYGGGGLTLGFAPLSANDARRYADSNASNVWTAQQLSTLTGGAITTARNSPGRFLPGTPEFNNAKDQVTKTSITNGGSLFFDQSSMYHTEGMYNFNKIVNPKTVEIIIGAHYRLYDLNSKGTVFDDLDRDLKVYETGGYIQVTKKMLQERVKLTASARYDKNQNFEGRFTPRIAAVYSMGENRQHNVRLSFQTAFRNPNLQDQYLNLTVNGIVKVIGGLPEFISRFNLQNNTILANSQNIANYQSVVAAQGSTVAKETATFKFGTFRPEFVNSFEIGYKGLISNKLFIDSYAYYNQYSNFIGTQTLLAGLNGADVSTIRFSNGNPVNGTFGVFQVPVNATTDLTSFGWAVSLDYNLPANFTIGGNVSLNKLGDLPSGTPVGFRTQFNSPDYRTNVSLANKKIANSNWGFNLIWRWQNTFVWQSSFGDGIIPEYHTIDMQVSRRLKGLKSIAKIGGTNLFNQYYTQSFGNPQIGSLYYVSLTFDQLLN